MPTSEAIAEPCYQMLSSVEHGRVKRFANELFYPLPAFPASHLLVLKIADLFLPELQRRSHLVQTEPWSAAAEQSLLPSRSAPGQTDGHATKDTVLDG